MANPPEYTLTDGTLKANIWKNETPNGTTFRTVTMEKSYKDKATGEWKPTDTLNVDDLLKVANLMQAVYNTIWKLKAADKAAARGDRNG